MREVRHERPELGSRGSTHEEESLRVVLLSCLSVVSRRPIATRRVFADHDHQGLDNRLITALAEPVNDNAPIVCRERLGGLLKHYFRAA